MRLSWQADTATRGRNIALLSLSAVNHGANSSSTSINPRCWASTKCHDSRHGLSAVPWLMPWIPERGSRA